MANNHSIEKYFTNILPFINIPCKNKIKNSKYCDTLYLSGIPNGPLLNLKALKNNYVK